MERLLNYAWGGSECRLSEEQARELTEHLSKYLCSTTGAVCTRVLKRFEVEYSLGGVQHVLHRLGFVYKKTKRVPGKADAEAQRTFVKKLEHLLAQKNAQNPVYFVDGTHPVHNAEPAYGPILKGKEKQIRANTGRMRLNLNGTLNAETHQVVIREDDTINAQSTIGLFQQLEELNPKAKKIRSLWNPCKTFRRMK